MNGNLPKGVFDRRGNAKSHRSSPFASKSSEYTHFFQSVFNFRHPIHVNVQERCLSDYCSWGFVLPYGIEGTGYGSEPF